MSSVQPLPPVPGTAFRALDYTANTGAWEGGLHEVRWGYEKGWLRSQVRRAILRRRWFEVTVVAGGLVIVAWIRDEGTTGAARVFVTELQTGTVLAHREGRGRPLSNLSVGPFACDGTDAWLRTADAELVLTRPPGGEGWTLEARFDGLQVQATLGDPASPPPVTVIGEHAPRRPGLTSHWNLLRTHGTATVAGRTFDLSDGHASIAYTNGFFPPNARWLEVTGLGTLPDGRQVGFAISDGNRHGDTHEHVLWIDGAVYEAPRVRLLIGGKVSRDTWRLRSREGDLELKLKPRASDVDTETRLYGSARTERVVGTFSGRIPLPEGGQAIIDGLPGVAADHRPLGWTRDPAR
ncbi:MAG: DUF2804 family protein [Myxococcota bacterium]